MNINDCFYVPTKHHISSGDLDSLMSVYTPSIGYLAVTVYTMLTTFSHDEKQAFPMRKVLDFLNCSLEDFEKSLTKCEQFNLVQTKRTKGKTHSEYLFILKQPLSIEQFIQHDVFGRYLMRVLDESYIEQLKRMHAVDYDEGQFDDVTQAFDASLLPMWDDTLEEKYQQPAKGIPVSKALSFNTSLFVKSTSTLLLPTKARTKKNIDEIERLGSLYQMDVVTMKGFVGKCTKPDSEFIDFEKLESLVLGYVNVGNTTTKSVYTEDSYRFFSSKQQGKAPGFRDKKVIAFLYEHYSFDQEVQNRLIEYVLSRFKGSFTKSLVQQIADSWVRAKIVSVSDVNKHLSKEKQHTHHDFVPTYMETSQPKKEKPEDEAKRQQLLDKLRKGE